MALIAAFLMWSGVGKSGSPGPKVGDVHALGFELFGGADDGGGGGNLNAVYAVG